MSKKVSKILWLGPVLNESLYSLPAVSPAACKWQESLIREFIACGVEVHVLTHVPTQLFPKGALWASGSQKALPHGIIGSVFGHLNFPFLREFYLKYLYLLKIKRALHSEHKYDLVLSYNIPHYLTYGAFYAQQLLKIPWIPLVADMTLHNNNWANFSTRVRLSTARVFLSWKNSLECPYGENYFFEGGVRKLIPEPKKAWTDCKMRIVYAGALTKSAGFGLFLEAIKLVDDKRFEFHICGKGDSQAVINVAKNDKRIIFHGAVSESELENVCIQADAFVNPRPLSLDESNNNFPSKIHEYLQYQKPILSTITAGVSPEYRDILIPISLEEPACLANCIAHLLEWDENDFETYGAMVRGFVARDKLWASQTSKLLSWIDKTVNAEN